MSSGQLARRDLSVVMPLKDCEPWVGEAVTSVLERADRLLELIVVDDESSDAGPAIAEAFGGVVEVVCSTGRGPAAARNTGIRTARGALIGFLDADDVWTAGTPDPRITALDDDEGLVLGAGRLQPVTTALEPFTAPLPGVLAGSVIARTGVFAGGGLLFDETRLHGEDVDWRQRVREAGHRSVSLGEVTALYRRRPGSLTSRREDNRGAITELVHASLKRRGVI